MRRGQVGWGLSYHSGDSAVWPPLGSHTWEQCS